MLPAPARMTAGDDFRRTVRGGVRSARPTVVVHGRHTDAPTRVGFVVSRAVGNAVTRNRVKRRLRHLGRDLLADTPAGTHLVVRALPAAGRSAELSEDLGSAWRGCLRKLEAGA
ncbi:ribonuclease P protein component [Naumannella cuiyingiana]|uniref:ribonuclease P protein component n=1 Tax=Naumannella cuiyingiana TaxID=1347891 RepID=UPI0015C69D10